MIAVFEINIAIWPCTKWLVACYFSSSLLLSASTSRAGFGFSLRLGLETEVEGESNTGNGSADWSS